MTHKQQAQERESTAFHLAAHAAVAFLLGRKVPRLWLPAELEPDAPISCCQQFLPPSLMGKSPRTSPGRRSIEDTVLVLLAGPVAEMKTPRQCSRGLAARDRRLAAELACLLCETMEEVDCYLAWLEVRATNVLKDKINWAGVVNLAEVLQSEGTLAHRKARAAFIEGQDAWFAEHGCGLSFPGSPDEPPEEA